MSDIQELACSYAALILHDDGSPIEAEKITTLCKTAGIKVQSFWPALFAKALAGRNVDDIILTCGGGGGAAAAGDAAAAGGDAPEEKAEAKKEEPEEEEEEEDGDMGFGLFD